MLARAHARTGDAAQIAGYLGKSDRFDEALVEFAVRYADQNDADYALFKDAHRMGASKRGSKNQRARLPSRAPKISRSKHTCVGALTRVLCGVKDA